MRHTALLAAAVAAVSLSLVGPAQAGQDYMDRMILLDRLKRDEARGGPSIKGGRSPFQQRVKVCNEMPTPVRDPKTGELVKVMKEVCWME